MIDIESNSHVHALAFQLKKQGKSLCGDSFTMVTTDDYFICAVSDGLGSGELAHESSEAVSRIVNEHHEEDVGSLFRRANEALKHKRGATVSIFKVDFSTKQFTYASVGNVRFVLYSPSDRFVYPLPVLGYMSGKPQKYKVHTYSYEPGSKFIVHTDGLQVPGVKSLLKNNRSVEDISESLEIYTHARMDDLTYIVGQLL
ncbi:SpoIIE family protein phosphatase [Metabacillus sp. GX 13764]|uniref:PP2C family serine/threonine-protein phosphatase n=1 Tax=Metabacillus kandeliae TaxID=2900151 RepID=UPI001E5D1FA3|nr:PP2C family serine/threonine-protein phosphatase [Metabacillus kandeliae]MCD7036718.1 SpoIIE family protein phosphatase [Metabacillus kandeliae]